MAFSLKRLRLRLGWAAVAPYLIFARPTPRLMVAGAVLAVLGLALRAWAAGTIHKNKVLTTGGPYAHTRNPLYLGTFLIGLGLAVAGGQVVFVVFFLVLFALIYGRSMQVEARRMEHLFGPDYHNYSASVPLFLPRLTPYHPGESHPTSFLVSRYLRHGEHQTALGLLLGFLALAAKLVLF